MRLTFIITIDPVKEIDYLNVLVHSLNLQTVQAFDVVFYNQTLRGETSIFSALQVQPGFPYRFFSIDRQYFLGEYPLWDLYAFHAFLLEEDLVGDYLMCLHMEEFLDVDYVEQVLPVLEKEALDILMGNLTRSKIELADITPLLTAGTPETYRAFLEQPAFRDAFHWCFSSKRLFTKNLRATRENVLNYIGFGFSRNIRPGRKGFMTMPWYAAEDVYFMSKAFARKYNWFLAGHSLFFEDIHICEIPGVCALGKELRKVTTFPAYFNRRKIYHISHGRYYFQFLDDAFAARLLTYETDDPALCSLQKAVRKFRNGSFSLSEALNYSRRNPEKKGTQDLNYRYHLKYLPAG